MFKDFPLIKESSSYKNFLTPKLSLRYSPNDTKNYIKELRRLLTDKNYYEEAQESNIALSKSLSWKQQSFKLVQSMGMPQ